MLAVLNTGFKCRPTGTKVTPIAPSTNAPHPQTHLPAPPRPPPSTPPTIGHTATPPILSSEGRSNKPDRLPLSTAVAREESVAAGGFLLITKSKFCPASIIRGTVKQQSRSLVLTWFTCRREGVSEPSESPALPK